MPSVSIIVISLDGSRGGNVPKLLQDIERQTVKEKELFVVTHTSPNGKARNEGIRKAKGEFLIFLDDDVRLGHERIFQNLLKGFEEKQNVGMTGGSIRLPQDANAFMKRVGEELPRWQIPVVEKAKESDLVTTACCAIPRKVLDDVGLFHEGLRRGVDPELRARLRKRGYPILLLPDTFFFHPLPKNLKELIEYSYSRGAGAAYGQRYFPNLRYEVPAFGKELQKEKRPFLYRLFRNLSVLGLALLTFKWLRLTDELSYGVGFVSFYLKSTLSGASHGEKAS